MFDTIRLQSQLARGPEGRPVLILGSMFAVALGAVVWLMPTGNRYLTWGALAALCLVMVPLLWREGYTWIILWLAPVAALDPFPDPLIRAAKYGLVLAAVAVALLKRRIAAPKPAKFDARPFYPAIALLAWCWIRAVTGGTPLAGSFEALRLTLVGALVYLWLSETPVAKGRRRWYYLWLIMGLYQVGACLVESIRWGRLRSYGTFASPNALGAFLVLTIAAVLAAAIWAPSRRARIISWLSLPVLTFGLYLSGSRASWLATAVAVMVMVLVARHWKLLTLSIVVLGVMGTIYATNPVVNFAVNAALRVQGGLTHRPMLWDAADRAIREAPWLGYGLEAGGGPMSAHAHYPSDVHRHMVADIVDVGSPHNFYRELTLETGVIGLVLLILTILALIRFNFRSITTRDRWRAVYALAVVGTSIGVAVHSWFERSIFLGSMSAAVFYWFLVAQAARPDDPTNESS